MSATYLTPNRILWELTPELTNMILDFLDLLENDSKVADWLTSDDEEARRAATRLLKIKKKMETINVNNK